MKRQGRLQDTRAVAATVLRHQSVSGHCSLLSVLSSGSMTYLVSEIAAARLHLV